MPKLVKKAIGLAGLAASATGNNKVQPDFGSKAEIITNSPAVDKNYPSLKESLRDLEASPLRDFHHEHTTTGQNPGTFETDDLDEALKDWDKTIGQNPGTFTNSPTVKESSGDFVGYKTIGQNPGTFTNSPTVKNYPSLKESLRDLEESPLRDFNHDDITTGQNPGTFKQNNWDEALKDWDDTKYGGRKRTKRYKRRLTHRKKKTIKRRKTRRTKRRR